MEEVKNHETVSADCPTAGDSLAFVLFWWDSSMGVEETEKYSHFEDCWTHQCWTILSAKQKLVKGVIPGAILSLAHHHEAKTLTGNSWTTECFLAGCGLDFEPVELCYLGWKWATLILRESWSSHTWCDFTEGKVPFIYFFFKVKEDKWQCWDSWNMLGKNHMFILWYKILRPCWLKFSVQAFLSTGWELPLPRAVGPGKAMARLLSADSGLRGDWRCPGYRECSGKPHPPFFFFTIRSASGAFSAMTWDLLRLHSFLLDLLIRFSLSSLRGTSSTRAPDEALRSTSGSRTDL